MGTRITIILDDKLVERLRKIQSEMISKENRSVSFSEVLGNAVQKGIKK